MSAVLFYTVGLPGAGKTTFASALSFWLGASHVRADKIGLELFYFPTYSPRERQMVYAEMNRQTVQNLRDGRHVVYDAAVNTRLQREQLEKLATQYDVEAIGLWIQVPTELAKNRAGTLREVGLGPVGRIIPPHIFDQYVAAFETPYSDEHTAIVAGDACFALQYRQLLRQLPSARLPKLI